MGRFCGHPSDLLSCAVQIMKQLLFQPDSNFVYKVFLPISLKLQPVVLFMNKTCFKGVYSFLKNNYKSAKHVTWHTHFRSIYSNSYQAKIIIVEFGVKSYSRGGGSL